MNYALIWAFRRSRRAFRYIFARYISTPLPNSRSRPRFPFPFPFPHGSQRMPLQSLTLSSLQAYKSTSQRVKKKYPFRSLRQRRIGRSEWKEEVHESHLVPFRVISRSFADIKQKSPSVSAEASVMRVATTYFPTT